ncbi:MAG TPA: hypothetical protein P5191_04485 [Ruminococcus sp.]|nr:hypothetical protein [Ruminococcus sp.]
MKTKKDAEKLASLMEKIGKGAEKRCKAEVTDMDSPLGMNIGNALEIAEAIEVLQGKCKGRLYDTSIELAADILELAGKGDNQQCRKLAEESVASGKALDVLRRTIMLQGGDPAVCDDVSLLPQARCSYEVRAMQDMKILRIDSEEIGMTSLLLGAGRLKKDDHVDATAGIVMHIQPGDTVSTGDKLMTLYSTLCSDFSDAAVRALNAIDFESVNCHKPLT